MKNKVQAAFYVSVLCGQCFQQCLAQIVQPLRLGGGEAHGGDSAVVVAQAACIKRVKYGLRLGNGREGLAVGGNTKVITNDLYRNMNSSQMSHSNRFENY